MTAEPTPTETRLAALADGSLDRKRRKHVLDEVERSPELQNALTEQRRAVEMIGALQERAPDDLHTRIDAMIPPRRTSRPRIAPRFGIAGAAAAAFAALVVAIGLSGGGSSALTVQQAAAFTLSPATMEAPAENPVHRNQLDVSVDGVSFPYWEGRFGWRSSGTRTDRIDGRSVTTVFYSDPRGRRIGYAIVSGAAWTTDEGTVAWRSGIPYRLLTHDGATVVAWPRHGHMCVVSGRSVSAATLLGLAAWRGERSSAV